MKLITEANAPDFEAISEFLYEDVKLPNGEVQKQPFIKGIFMQADKQNRNGRVYPLKLLQPSVSAYVQDRFPNPHLGKNKWRSYGELGHPEGVEINLHRVSHIINELNWDGPNCIGKAKLVDTEYGRIGQSLLAADGQLGVSSRGVGALDESVGGGKMVTEYELIAVDIVSDPSAPDGFVDGILESVDFIRAGGKYTENSLKRSDLAFSGLKKALEDIPKHERNQYLNECIKDFLKTL